MEEGITQMAKKAPTGSNRNTVVWNFPMEVSLIFFFFLFFNLEFFHRFIFLLLHHMDVNKILHIYLLMLKGPRLVVCIYGCDFFGRDILLGTGSVVVFLLLKVVIV
jgi:hypothetical protein